MKSHTILFEKTARYFTLGEPHPDVQYFWIVCHGYGQLASKIIYKFDDLGPSKNFVLAPEALSRFYWNRAASEPVGASWMTKKDRLEEIADYTRFIKKLYDEYVLRMADEVKIILFGFSQGCATQVRWLMRAFPRFDYLVLWAGLLPEDLDYTPHADYFSHKKLHWVYGTKDQFLNEDRIKWHHQFMEEQNLNFTTTVFDGKHKIERAVLLDWFEKIKSEG